MWQSVHKKSYVFVGVKKIGKDSVSAAGLTTEPFPCINYM